MQNMAIIALKLTFEPLDLLRGQLPPKATSLVLEWAGIHQSDLFAQWQRARRHEPLEKIPPLE